MAFKFPDYPEGVHLPPEYTPASLPPCECDDCKQSFLTAQQQQCYAQFRYREWPSHAADLVRVSSHFVRQASEAKDHVAERLSLHADLLMNRWRKRSQEKRRQLLHDVAPELEEKQWIVPRHVYEVGWNQKPNDRTPERRRHLLLPWLSVEGLTTNPTLLFALLYYRSRYPLYDWAAYDSRQLELSWQSGHFDLCHAASCVVMYGPRYGAIVDWDEKQAHTGHIIGFPRARLVLEAQALLFTVLSKIVDAILLGVDDSTTTPRTEKWRLQTTMGFRSAEEIERWSPYTFSPFSEPPRLDVDYLVSLAKTRREEAFDHLTDLQCDPMYLRRYIKPILDKKLLDSEKGERVSELAMDILDDVTDYLMWLWTEQECLKVRALHKRFSDSVYPGRPMPPKYDQALGSLEGLLSIWMNQFGGIDRKLRCAPGFLHYSKRVRVDYHGSSAIGVKRVRDVNTKESLEGDRPT
ncbi:hypothetical protein CkaCkLH20_00718 [Colletotrichum karsti]|uniref:Uncharacterized protein n=1 Tax=Colletotrichum karsti TaxID=1095194 RepID=A0A9P6IFP7_9PEZI|nr:uncharacterized protein CkaCkLH20_00718 [Colletotrichum karsti]KAF9881572.1 hypothetical protein CkaCkLH20_00718 [Colletotrichum karsti]